MDAPSGVIGLIQKPDSCRQKAAPGLKQTSRYDPICLLVEGILQFLIPMCSSAKEKRALLYALIQKSNSCRQEWMGFTCSRLRGVFGLTQTPFRPTENVLLV